MILAGILCRDRSRTLWTSWVPSHSRYSVILLFPLRYLRNSIIRFTHWLVKVSLFVILHVSELQRRKCFAVSRTPCRVCSILNCKGTSIWLAFWMVMQSDSLLDNYFGYLITICSGCIGRKWQGSFCFNLTIKTPESLFWINTSNQLLEMGSWQINMWSHIMVFFLLSFNYLSTPTCQERS